MQFRLAVRFLCLFIALTTSIPALAANTVWLEINVTDMSLTVWEGNKAVRYYGNIAIGSGGVSDVHYMGDESTPVGEYRVLWLNRDSVFDNFIGLDYPTEKHIELAAKAGRLSSTDYRRLVYSVRAGQAPPFNTPLGGRIGVHGIGHGSRLIHETVNWTDGCVALTNEEMRELMRWVRIGTRVSIHR